MINGFMEWIIKWFWRLLIGSIILALILSAGTVGHVWATIFHILAQLFGPIIGHHGVKVH